MFYTRNSAPYLKALHFFKTPLTDKVIFFVSYMSHLKALYILKTPLMDRSIFFGMSWMSCLKTTSLLVENIFFFLCTRYILFNVCVLKLREFSLASLMSNAGSGPIINTGQDRRQGLYLLQIQKNM